MSTVQPPDPGVYAVLQSFTPGAIIELFDLDLGTIFAGGPVLRFTGSVNPDGHYIIRDGETYTPIPMQAEGFDADGRGAIPQPLVRVSNVHAVLQPLLDQAGGLLGAELTRLVVSADWLDTGSDPQPGWHMRKDVHRVEQVTNVDANWIEFRLAAAVDIGKEQTPRRQAVRSECLWIYRTYDPTVPGFVYDHATCPYQGSTYFDEDNQTTADPAADRCSKSLTGCRLRFDPDPLPFGGFLGIGTRR